MHRTACFFLKQRIKETETDAEKFKVIHRQTNAIIIIMLTKI